jgi:hypothetical protein
MQDIEPTANSQRVRVDHRRGRPTSESGQERHFRDLPRHVRFTPNTHRDSGHAGYSSVP